MGYIVYFNVIRSKDIINSSYNVRLDSMADRVVRGKILDKDGNVLAETVVDEDGNEQRVYPYAELYAHVVGYDSKGKSGLESIENFNLLTSNAFFVEKIVKEFQEKKNIGDNVVTTLDTRLQQTAYDALGNYKGAVIVMEVSTGKILSMVSKPDFNPNTIGKDWASITTGEESVLLNRVTQGAYAPGSVFKLVTTLAYMRENNAYANYSYTCESEIVHEGTTIHCAKNRKHGEEDLQTSLAKSCNTSFSNIGLSLNISKFQNTAKDLLFNSKLPGALPYSQSKFQLTKDASDAEIMMTAIGQGKTQMSPYHMVLITSAIANGGILMEPYLVSHIENYTGNVIEKNMPHKYAQLMTSEEAAQLKEYMKAVVTSGTATALNGQSYSIAGKTGTAEYSSDKEKAHSWFAGFTNVENPDLAICVVVESADNSGMSAVAVTKKILNSYYN
ncbi:MAG: penicillin-binding protein 2 [Tyzzerella sp.]|nr:penicillin-binding protein 2 [Tyzzerella sp.]